MRMLTLWQPWASLAVLEGIKDHETRGWKYPTSLHGHEIAIHAAASKVNDRLITPELEAVCVACFGTDWRSVLPRGAVVGTVRLAGCYPAEEREATWWDRACGDWTPGRFVWALADKHVLPEPVPAKGKQGWGSYL